MVDDKNKYDAFWDWLKDQYGWNVLHATRYNMGGLFSGKEEVDETNPYFMQWVELGKPSKKLEAVPPEVSQTQINKADEYLYNAKTMALQWVVDGSWTEEEKNAALNLLYDDIISMPIGGDLPDWRVQTGTDSAGNAIYETIITYDDLQTNVTKLRTDYQKQIQSYLTGVSKGEYEPSEVFALIQNYSNNGLLLPEYSDYALGQMVRLEPNLATDPSYKAPPPSEYPPVPFDPIEDAGIHARNQAFISDANMRIDSYVRSGATGWDAAAGDRAKALITQQVGEFGVQPNTFMYEQVIEIPRQNALAQEQYAAEVERVRETLELQKADISKVPPPTESEAGAEYLLRLFTQRKTMQGPGVTFTQWLQSPEGQAIQTYTGVSMVTGGGKAEAQVEFLKAQKRAREYAGDVRGVEETSAKLETAERAQSLAAKGVEFLGGQAAYASRHPEYATMTGEERRELSAAGLEAAGHGKSQYELTQEARATAMEERAAKKLAFVPYEPPTSTAGMVESGVLNYRQWFNRNYPSIVSSFLDKPREERTEETWDVILKRGKEAIGSDYYRQSEYQRGESSARQAPKTKTVKFG